MNHKEEFNKLSQDDKNEYIRLFHLDKMDELSSQEEKSLIEYCNSYLKDADIDTVDFSLSIPGFCEWYNDQNRY